MQFNEVLEFIDTEHKRLIERFHPNSSKKEIILSGTVKISEEVGELCSEVLHSFGDQRKEKTENHVNEIDLEFADVIITTLLLARSMNIDINKALETKINKIRKRVY